MEHSLTDSPRQITAPVINPMARDRLEALISRTMTPATVESVLHNAINGDLRAQSLVFVAMMDTWPRLQKAISEVAREAAQAPYQVTAYARRNDDPSPEAVKKAEFVEDAIAALKPYPARNEYDLPGLIEFFAYGYFTGFAVGEIYYHLNGTARALGGVDPMHYGYPRSQSEPDRLMLNRSGHYNGELEDFADWPNKFLVGVNRGHMGHASIAAPMRSLVLWWLGSHYGLKWMMQFAQVYGVPLRWATYPVGDACAMTAVAEMLENIGAAGWGAFPEGTKLDIKESSRGAGDLPQKLLIEMADRQADIAILGQSLTTDVADSGSRALGDVHQTVRRDAIDGVCQWVASILTHQFVPAIIASGGFSDASDMPKVTLDWPEAEDETAKAERDKILFGELGLPASRTWLYERHGVPLPEPGEDVFEKPQMAPPAIPGGDDDEGDDEEKGPIKEKPVEARRVEAQEPARAIQRPVIDQLTDRVLEDLSGTAAAYLAGVRPAFRRLTLMAMDGQVSDDDFIAALETAARQMPELFESLNITELQSALERAIGTGMLAGVGERIITSGK